MLAAEGVDNAVDAKVCRSLWGLSAANGIYCAPETSYRHAVVKIAFDLIKHAPLTTVRWIMDEMIASATEHYVYHSYGTEFMLCIEAEDAFNLGQVVGNMVETYFPPVAAYSNSSNLHQCCHPVCDQVMSTFKSPFEASQAGSLSVSFEQIGFGCCEIARVDVQGCQAEHLPTRPPAPPTPTPTPMPTATTIPAQDLDRI
mmetsp:Transcript_2791/g.6105  ORF Transcript_2791/g.6105 Transcript_2791/m.6105 type:complete len:200 (-) Transcript_2791:945-1544(-)